MLQTLLKPALPCVFPAQFFFWCKMLSFSLEMLEIFLPTHKLESGLSWLFFPHQNHPEIFFRGRLYCKDIFIFYFFLLVNCAKHTKTHCVTAPKCATWTHTWGVFFHAHPKRSHCMFLRGHTQVPTCIFYPWQEPAYRMSYPNIRAILNSYDFWQYSSRALHD